MEQQHSKGHFPECPRAKKRHLTVYWYPYETFPVPVRHRCLKLPRARWTRFLRQQVARG